MASASENFRFLYRGDKGVINRAGWMAGALPLLASLAMLTAVLREAMGYANRDLSQRAFIDGPTIAAFAYIIFYAFAIMVLGVCWMNLTAKRFRDRGRPGPLGLAGLLPLALLATGAMHWLQPRVSDTLPRWSVSLCDGLTVLILLWTLAEVFDFLPRSKQK